MTSESHVVGRPVVQERETVYVLGVHNASGTVNGSGSRGCSSRGGGAGGS